MTAAPGVNGGAQASAASETAERAAWAIRSATAAGWET